MGYQGRDVEVVFTSNLCMVVACDSCGGIGEKEFDVVKVPPYLTGRFTTRVALFEVIAAGAHPQVLTATICNEPTPTGEELLEGVKDELERNKLGSVSIGISCEKNIPTQQTGLGITVVGWNEAKSLRIATTRPGDEVYCLGIPKVGSEVVSPDDPEIVQTEHLRLLLKDSMVHDIIPVGSQGISGEIQTLAMALDISFVESTFRSLKSSLENMKGLGALNVHKSGGPGTCILFTASPGFDSKLKLYETQQIFGCLPLFKLGSFY